MDHQANEQQKAIFEFVGDQFKGVVEDLNNLGCDVRVTEVIT